MKRRLAFVLVIGLALSALIVAQTGSPITVGPTPVPIYAPGRGATVTIVQTAGTATVYVIYGINRNVVANKAASSTYTFTPNPGTFYNAGQSLGFISIPRGTATFAASVGSQAPGAGTVTSIATTSPITGGTITSTGTIACATCGVTGSPLSQFAATTSAQLAGVVSDETGTGALVFGTSPTLTTPALGAATATSVAVGGGTAVTKILTGTGTLDFANQAAIGCNDLTITVTGAVDGDPVTLGVPNGSVPSASSIFFGWVSASDTVTVRYCALVSGNPASGTFRATVTHF